MKITRNIRVVSENYYDCGMKRTYAALEITRPDGYRIMIPMTPPIKVRRYTQKTDIMDSTVRLSKRDCEEIFERYIISTLRGDASVA